MTERPETATLYVWEKDSSKFSMDRLIFLFGGQKPPRDDELSNHRFGIPMYCTQDFRIYPVSKEQDKKTRINNGLSAWEKYDLSDWDIYFKTIQIETRFEKYGLTLPDHEISFCQ